MSLTPTLQTALSVVFILTIAAAISVTAQTQAVADSTSAKPLASAVSTSASIKAESKKPPTATSESAAPDRTSDVNPGVGVDSNAVTGASATTAAAKTEMPSETAAPRNPQTAAADKWQFQF